MQAAVLSVAAQAPAAEDGREALKARIQAAPLDVSAFIDRRVGCNHFDGEVGSEYPEREQMIRDAPNKLRCDEVGRDERALRDQHRASAEVLRLLDETRHLTPW